MLLLSVFTTAYTLDDATVSIAVSKFWEFNVEHVLQELQGVEIALAKLELLVKESEDSGLPGSERLRADLDKIRSLKQDVEVLKASLKYKAYAKELRILEFQVGDVISGRETAAVCSHISYENRLLAASHVDFHLILWVSNCVSKDSFALT